MAAFITDDKGNFLWVSTEFSDMLGYPKEQINKLSYLDISAPEDLEDCKEKFHSLKSKSYSYFSLYKKFIRKDGTPLQANIRISTYASSHPSKQEVIGFVDFEGDTDYFQDSNYRSIEKIIIDNLPIGILIIGKSGNIGYANHYIEKRSGYTLRELRNQHVYLLISEEEDSRIREAFSLTDEKKIKIESTFKRKNGTVLPVELIVMLLPIASRKGNSVIVFAQNITTRKKEEKVIKDIKSYFTRAYQTMGTLMEDFNQKDFSDNTVLLKQYNLTERERVVLFEVMEGKTTKEIAFNLNLAEITIRKHLSSIYRKFNVSGRQELIIRLHDKFLE